MIAALAGRRIDLPGAPPRFPLKNAEAVARQLRTLLEKELAAKVLVCSAACGADLLALDAARNLRIRTRIVLPFDLDRFRCTSVVDRPGNAIWDWGSMFDAFCRDAQNNSDLVIIPGRGDDPVAAYAAASEQIIDEAIALAAIPSDWEGKESLRDRVTAVVVWDRDDRGKDDLTAKFAHRARAAKIPVREIDTLLKTK